MTTGTPDPYRRGRAPGAGGPPPRRRSRARTLLPLAVAVWAVLEFWVLIALADVAGVLIVPAALLVGLVLGTIVIRRAGKRAWSRLLAGLRPDATPEARAAASRGGSSVLTMLGGVLLILPGLLSDVAGLLCLFPPTARLLGRAGERFLARRSGFTPGTLGDAVHQARAARDQVHIHRPDGKIVRGEVVRDDEPPAD